MEKKKLILFFLLTAHLVPLLIVGIFYAVRFAPASMLNLPNKEYSVQEENRKRLNDYLLNSSLWLAGAHMLLFTALFHFVSIANQHSPAHLNPSVPLTATLGYTVVILGWTIGLVMWLTKKATV